MNTKRFFLFAVLAIMAVTVSAQADDLNPPPWRGQPGTTFQEWTFDQPGPLPTNWDNPYGDPLLLNPGQWQPGQMIDRELTFVIPNRPDPNEYKHIRIQATYSGPAGFVLEPMVEIHSDPQTQGWQTGGGFQPNPNPTNPNSMYAWWDFTLKPNPRIEWITISGGPLVTFPIYWDQIVIDTWCTEAPPVPEPMSMTLAGIGLLGVIGNRFKARKIV